MMQTESSAPKRHTDETIYRWIADAIFDQRLPSGTKLPEDNLGEIFAVSRTVVRKALFRLASDKLVDMRPNRGAAVASPTVEEARQVFETRRVIEAATTTAAVARMTAADREHLQQIVDEDHQQASASDDQRRSQIRHSGDFHLALARIGGNQVMTAFLEELIGRTSLIIGLYETRDGLACTCREHSALLAPILAGDAETAQARMTEHLIACEQRLGLSDRDKPVDLRDIFSQAIS